MWAWDGPSAGRGVVGLLCVCFVVVIVVMAWGFLGYVLVDVDITGLVGWDSWGDWAFGDETGILWSGLDLDDGEMGLDVVEWQGLAGRWWDGLLVSCCRVCACFWWLDGWDGAWCAGGDRVVGGRGDLLAVCRDLGGQGLDVV